MGPDKPGKHLEDTRPRRAPWTRSHDVTTGHTHGEYVLLALNQDVRSDRHTWIYGDSRNVEQTAPSGTQHTTWESSLSFAVCVGGLLVRNEPPTPTPTPGSPAASFPGRRDSNEQLRWMLGSGKDGEAELHALPFLFSFHAVMRPSHCLHSC